MEKFESNERNNERYCAILVGNREIQRKNGRKVDDVKKKEANRVRGNKNFIKVNNRISTWILKWDWKCGRKKGEGRSWVGFGRFGQFDAVLINKKKKNERSGEKNVCFLYVCNVEVGYTPFENS